MMGAIVEAVRRFYRLVIARMVREELFSRRIVVVGAEIC